MFTLQLQLLEITALGAKVTSLLASLIVHLDTQKEYKECQEGSMGLTWGPLIIIQNLQDKYLRKKYNFGVLRKLL